MTDEGDETAILAPLFVLYFGKLCYLFHVLLARNVTRNK
jgi:hypothetical protein